jgi:hypothetical protein
VHVVQSGPNNPKTATTPEQWMVGRAEARNYWPNVMVANLNLPEPVLPVPNPRNFGIVDAVGTVAVASLIPVAERPRGVDGGPPLPPIALWPRSLRLVAISLSAQLPVPAVETFRYTRVWKVHVRVAAKPPVKKNVVTSGTNPQAPKPIPATAARASATKYAPPVPPRSLPQTQRLSGHQI